MPKGQEFTYAVRAQGRLQSAEEFGEIVVRANPDGSMVRVKDVARIELGAQNYNAHRPAQRQARRARRALPAARLQCDRRRRRREEADGAS